MWYKQSTRVYSGSIFQAKRALNLIKADSEALAIMDKNTVMYMCEDIKNTIQLQKEQLAEKNAAIAERNAVTTEKDKIIEE